MAFDPSHLRLRGAHMKSRSAVEKRADCSTGGFYVYPSTGVSVDALQPLEIKWDPSCVEGTDKVDIYVKAPQTSTPMLQEFAGVDLASGSFTTTLQPRWWGATPSVTLQLAIFKAGDMPIMNDLPAGPLFTATYAAPADGSIPESADVTITDNNVVTDVAGAAAAGSSLSKGKIAAGVLVPLLFFICLGVLAWIKFKRVKQNQKTLAFSEKIDRRMSVVSGDWKSMTPSGAKEAVRASMHQQENSRFSTFSYGNSNGNRSSTFATEGVPNGAGLGANRGPYAQDNGSVGNFDYVNGYKTHTPRQRSHSNNVMRPSFTQSRVSFADSVTAPPSHLRNPRGSVAEGHRQSRGVSFADGGRPSVDRQSRSIGQGERGSRAFHNGYTVGIDEDVPPVPRRASQDSQNILSPKQRAGALALSNDEINSQMSRDDEDIGAAISYIQGPVEPQDVLFAVPPTPGPYTASAAAPLTPSPTYSPTSGGFFSQQQASSAKVAVSPLGPMPMSSGAEDPNKFMSPDDMLRAYALRQKQQQQGGMMSPATGGAQPMVRGPGRAQGQGAAWGEDAYGGM